MFWEKQLVIDGGMGTELVRCGAKEVVLVQFPFKALFLYIISVTFFNNKSADNNDIASHPKVHLYSSGG